MLATPISAQKSENTVSSIYSRRIKLYSTAHKGYRKSSVTKAAVTRLRIRDCKKRQVTVNTFWVTHMIDFILERCHLTVLHLHIIGLHLNLRLQVWQLTLQSGDFLQYTQAWTCFSIKLKSERKVNSGKYRIERVREREGQLTAWQAGMLFLRMDSSSELEYLRRVWIPWAWAVSWWSSASLRFSFISSFQEQIKQITIKFHSKKWHRLQP